MMPIDARFEGFDARSWHRLVALAAPGLASRAPNGVEGGKGPGEGGLLFVLFHGDRVVQALHTERGFVSVPVWTGREGLGALAKAHGARIAVAAESGALEELYERVGGRVRDDDDATASWLVVLGAVRELYDEGALSFWPTFLPTQVPLPSAVVVRRTMDYVLPPGRCVVLALFDPEGDLATGVLLHRDGEHLARVSGPEVIRRLVGPLGGDHRRDYRVMRRAIEARVAPLAAGVFAEIHTVERLLAETRPGAWAEAMAAREVIVDPLPAWMAVAVGSGVVRAAASRSKGVLEGLGVLGALTPMVRQARELLDRVGAFDVARTLGFDPLKSLAAWLQHARRGHRDDAV